MSMNPVLGAFCCLYLHVLETHSTVVFSPLLGSREFMLWLRDVQPGVGQSGEVLGFLNVLFGEGWGVHSMCK